MASIAMGGGAAECWVVRPHACRFPISGGRLLGAAVFVCGAIAAGFAVAGAWLVLPFAGAEILALGLTLCHLRRHAGDFERVSRDEDRLIVEIRHGIRTERHEFHPYWARLRILGPPDGKDCRLVIGSHGREVEIGRQLGYEEKRTLAAALRKNMGV